MLTLAAAEGAQKLPAWDASPRLLRVSAANTKNDVGPTLVVDGGIACIGRGPSNVPWCKLQRGPACMRRSGATAAVVRGANSDAKSMSAGVPPATSRWTEAAGPPGAATAR